MQQASGTANALHVIAIIGPGAHGFVATIDSLLVYYLVLHNLKHEHNLERNLTYCVHVVHAYSSNID